MENEQIKNLKTSIGISLVCITLLIGCCTIAILKRIDNLEKKLLKQDTLTSYNLPNNFNYAYSVLHDYNKHIDTNTVIKITETANRFNLTNNKQTFKMALGQLLIESGAKHYNKENRILTSETGALGISQILPNSAYGYLIKYIKDKDKLIFKQLGCDNFNFVFNKELNKADKINKIKGWLHNETNNIALWGFIMRKNMDLNHNDMEKSLVSYSDGVGGMRNYIDSGGNIKNHNYIVGINNKLNH